MRIRFELLAAVTSAENGRGPTDDQEAYLGDRQRSEKSLEVNA